MAPLEGWGSEITCSTPSSHKVRGPRSRPTPRRILGRQVEGRVVAPPSLFTHSGIR